MKTTTMYTVSTYNESPVNTIEYKGCSRLEADLKMLEAIRNNKHGVMIETVIVENNEFNYKKEESKIIKTF